MSARTRLLASWVIKPPIEWAMMITWWPEFRATQAIAWDRSAPRLVGSGLVTHKTGFPCPPAYLDQSKV
jgi:hypothetical protein